ncbi:hypothetical protein GGI64_001418 [Rhizobium leguminosarum]|uniref:Uncharacterized protein n=1 Tax=Rhizobium leguminosarum TaxID=384 RepID=A0A7Z0IX40_RHILE|nr:hypothetical protein [Rhizobium leguminosarum]NYJ10371.1 hypothetical protein [Rhizobium leguminosarum]
MPWRHAVADFDEGDTKLGQFQSEPVRCNVGRGKDEAVGVDRLVLARQMGDEDRRIALPALYAALRSN